MLTRTTKVLIGKDVDWAAEVVDNAEILDIYDHIVNGEVIVFDKYKNVLAAGATINDSEVIYIGQATGVTYNVTNEAGTTVTGVRKIIFSDPIEGSKVKSYVGRAYAAKSEQVTTFTCTALVVTAGTELVLRLVYRDMQEQTGGGQFVHSYHYTTVTGETVDTAAAAIAALVNAHKGRRVTASVVAGTDALILTALPVPEGTTDVDDIDGFKMVEFDAYLNYIDANDYPQETLATKATVANSYGNGNWEQVRDLEKAVQGYRGFTNQTTFPIKKPATSTVEGAIYNIITIESDKSYVSSDNQYVKQAPLTTIIAIPVAALQTADILGRLNPWMASCPGAFAAIVF